MTLQKQENQKRHRCSNCGSRFGYLRLRTHERVCRSCGNVEKIGEKSEQEPNKAE